MKKRIALLAIAGLIFLSLGAFAQQPPAKTEKPAPAKPGQTAPGPRGQQGPLARLQNFLNLTPEQVQKFKDFQKVRQDEQKSFRDQMQKLRGDLRPLLKDEKADKGKINGLIDQIAKLGADRAKQALGNRDGIQKILTPEQADKLKKAGPAVRQRLMNFFRGQGMAPGAGPMGGGQMMQPGMGQGMRGQGMGRGQGMLQGQRPGMGMRGQGMAPGQMGRGQMMRPGMLQRLMQRFPILRRLLGQRRMGGRFGAWW
jgi:Spy/CpxP family protein refolding chaperone